MESMNHEPCPSGATRVYSILLNSMKSSQLNFHKWIRKYSSNESLTRVESTGTSSLSFPPYIRSKGFVNRPRAARREPTREIIIIMTRYKGADVSWRKSEHINEMLSLMFHASHLVAQVKHCPGRVIHERSSPNGLSSATFAPDRLTVVTYDLASASRPIRANMA